ncbi:hypothetical protein BsWGS_27260 [Bradybaena similaris]
MVTAFYLVYCQPFLIHVCPHAMWHWISCLSRVFYLMYYQPFLMHVCPHAMRHWISCLSRAFYIMYCRKISDTHVHPCHVALFIMSVHSLLPHVQPTISGTHVLQHHENELSGIFPTFIIIHSISES